MPAGPGAPVGPAGPAAPATPVVPRGPWRPAGPCAPVGPVGPVAPSAPAAPVDPGAPAVPAGPVAPAAPVPPTFTVRSSVPGAPAGPVGPASPFAPLGPAGPCGPGVPMPAKPATRCASSCISLRLHFVLKETRFPVLFAQSTPDIGCVCPAASGASIGRAARMKTVRTRAIDMESSPQSRGGYSPFAPTSPLPGASTTPPPYLRRARGGGLSRCDV